MSARKLAATIPAPSQRLAACSPHLTGRAPLSDSPILSRGGHHSAGPHPPRKIAMPSVCSFAFPFVVGLGLLTFIAGPSRADIAPRDACDTVRAACNTAE